MYHCEVDDLYLIPTAEVPVTNIYRDVILEEKQLPIKNCAYTQCFRREAGSYGKDVRGLNRLHEFSKVELVRIDKPEHSRQSHKEMLDHVEGLLQKLELPYRILRLCGGDMSFTAALCFDFEMCIRDSLYSSLPSSAWIISNCMDIPGGEVSGLQY